MSRLETHYSWSTAPVPRPAACGNPRARKFTRRPAEVTCLNCKYSDRTTRLNSIARVAVESGVAELIVAHLDEFVARAQEAYDALYPEDARIHDVLAGEGLPNWKALKRLDVPVYVREIVGGR